MERIETINLKTETDASKRDTASPSTRSTNTADSCTTRISSQALRKNARTLRRLLPHHLQRRGRYAPIRPDDGNDYPNFESIIESIKTIWSNTPIWWERDGSVPGVDAGITYDELRGADMLANARKRLENEMRPRGIEPDGEQAVKDAETVRQAGLNAITPSFFELFEDYITEEDSQLAADGVELEARTAWMHEMYRAMLNTLKE